jgi:hypothetical protein
VAPAELLRNSESFLAADAFLAACLLLFSLLAFSLALAVLGHNSLVFRGKQALFLCVNKFC